MEKKKYRGGRKNSGRAFWAFLTLNYAQLFVRAVFLLFILAVTEKIGFPGFDESISWIAWSILAMVYIVTVVFPFRFFINGLKYASFDNGMHSRKGYGVFFHAGLARLLPGLCWGLPFFFSFFMLLYSYWGMALTEFFNILKKLGGFFGGNFDVGLLVWLIAIVLFGIMFMLLWSHQVQKDYIPLKNSVMRCFTRADALRKKNKAAWIRTLISNFFISIPGYACILFVFVRYVISSFSDKPEGLVSAFFGVLEVLEKPLPASVYLWMAVIIVFLHVPLCAFRQMRNAFLVWDQNRENVDKRA